MGGFTDRTDDAYFFFKKLSSSSAGDNTTSFLEVFDWKFWLATWAAVALSSLYLGLVLQTTSRKTSFRLSETIDSVAASATVVLRSYCLIGYDILLENPITKKRRWALSIWLLTVSLAGAMVFWSYNGCLISFLSVKIVEKRFSSLEGVGQSPDFKIFMSHDNPEHKVILARTEHNDALREIYDRNIAPYLTAPGEFIQVPDIKEKFIFGDDDDLGLVIPEFGIGLASGNDFR